MGETIKTWTLRFPAKENPNVAKALLALLANRVTVLRQGEVSVDFGHEVLHTSVGLKNQKPRARVCIRSINQSNRSISVCLSFLFCSRVFISCNTKISLSEKSSAPFARSQCSRMLLLSRLNRVGEPEYDPQGVT